MPTKKPKTNVKRKASSVRVAKKRRGISKLQGLAIAGVLALIGVVAVVASQASGTPKYQYAASKYCVAANGKTSEKAVQDCKNTSAEAMVYRLYSGLYDRTPDSGGYKYWTQQLAGDRIKVTQTSLVVEQVNKMGSDTAFVKALYANMLKRQATQKEVDQWVGRLKASGSNKWSRQKVVAQFAISGEAIRKNQASWNAFFASAPTVAVEQTAAKEQRARYQKMFDDYSQPATRDKEAAKAALDTAKAQSNAAAKSADKNPPSAADLNSIATNQTNASNASSAASSRAAAAAAKAEGAKRLFEDAKALGEYATDIGNNSAYSLKQIAARYRVTKNAATAAKSYAASAKARVNDIAKKYVVAQKKYEAEQKRLAELAARRIQEEIAKAKKSQRAGSTGATNTAGSTDNKGKLQQAANCAKFNKTASWYEGGGNSSGVWVHQDYVWKSDGKGGCTKIVSKRYTGQAHYPEINP